MGGHLLSHGQGSRNEYIRGKQSLIAVEHGLITAITPNFEMSECQRKSVSSAWLAELKANTVPDVQLLPSAAARASRASTSSSNSSAAWGLINCGASPSDSDGMWADSLAVEGFGLSRAEEGLWISTKGEGILTFDVKLQSITSSAPYRSASHSLHFLKC